MTVLKELQNILKPGHILTIKALDKDCWFRTLNKSSEDIKYLYKIHIDALDSKAGQGFIEHQNFTLADIAPSKLSYEYCKVINALLEKLSNGKMYISCTSECGTNIEYQIMWNKNRTLKAA